MRRWRRRETRAGGRRSSCRLRSDQIDSWPRDLECQAAATCRWTSKSPRAEPPLERGGHAEVFTPSKHVNRSPPERMMTMKQLDCVRHARRCPRVSRLVGSWVAPASAMFPQRSRPTREQAGGTAMFPLKASGVRSRGDVISRGGGRAKFRNGPVGGRSARTIALEAGTELQTRR